MTPEHINTWPQTLVPGPHFCAGRSPFNQTAFVFSVPGSEEEREDQPISGRTGENLNCALTKLHTARPDIFGSLYRFDYRITNAYPVPLFKSKHGRSEATAVELKDERNLDRLRQELAGCLRVVFCGAKAQYMAALLRDWPPDARIVAVPHVGLRGLLTLSDRTIRALPTSVERTDARVQAWTRQVLNGLE